MRPATGAFGAMVRRDMREHAGAALFAFVGICLFFLISAGLRRPVTAPSSVTFDATIEVGMSAATEVIVGLFTITSALAGLILGRAVIVGDRSGDDRAFLVHRPMSGVEIFFAKLVAAGALYAIAAGVPLIARTVWSAMPAHQSAPYDLRLALADVADFTAGFVYVLGGMSMALRRRAFADRGVLVLGGPLMCSILVVALQEFWQAELIVVLSLVIIGAATLATFTSIAGYEGQSRPARASLALIVGLGWQLGGGIAFAIVSFFAVIDGSISTRSTKTVLTRAGQLVRVTTQFGPGVGPMPRIVAVSDLRGNPLPAFRDSATIDSLAYGVESTQAISLAPGHSPSPFDERSYRSTNRVYVPVGSAGGGFDPTAWYFVRDRALIAAYSFRTRQLVGWIGRDGYHAGATPTGTKFRGELRPGTEYPFWSSLSLLVFSHDVYRIDRQHRDVTRIFTAADTETVTGAASSENDQRELPFLPRGAHVRLDSTQRFDAIATTRAVHLQSVTGEPWLTLPHDPSVAGYGTVTVSRAPAAPGAPTVFRYDAVNGTLDRATQHRSPPRAFVVSNQGSLAQRLTLPRDTYDEGEPRFSWTVPLAAFVMPLAERVSERVSDAINDDSSDAMNTPVMWIVTVVGSLIAVAAVIAIGRAYAFSTRRITVWTAGALLFGFVGLLTMLALVARPAREPCPACGRKRVVTHERCEHCGAPFPAPAPDGTEIFEPVSATLVPS